MKPLSLLLSLTLVALLAADAWAKRVDPKPVEPVVYQGVKYVAPNSNGREGKIEAHSEKTGKKLWDAVIYKVKIEPNLEEDVQWVFISALERRDNTLLVTNEKNEKCVLDLKTHKVKKMENDRKPSPGKMTDNEATRMTVQAVEPLVRKFALRETPSLNPSVRFKIEEYDVRGLWKALSVQLFLVRYLSSDGGEFNVKSLMLYDGKVTEFAGAFGGHGPMSAVLTDNILYYTYSRGSGLRRSIVGRLQAADSKVKIAESRGFNFTDLFIKEVGGRIQVESGEYVAFNSWKAQKQVGWVKVDGNSLRIVDAAGTEVPEVKQR